MGTRLRYLNGTNLRELQEIIEALPHKIEIKAINNVSGQWYIHFCLNDFDPNPNVVKSKEEKEIELTGNTRKKRGRATNRR